MARTLSDGLIIAMIEATTRLAGARGGPGAKATGGKDAEGAAKDDAPAAEARTADQVGDDFAAIYRRIEDVVRVSAEQETKAVGFTVR